MQEQTQQTQQALPPQQKKKRWITDQNHFQNSSVISAALLAIFLIILQAFIGLGLHTVCSYIVVISLAVSAPCLAGRIVIMTHEQKYRYRQNAAIINSLYFFGLLFGFTGLAATFWYMSPIAGIVFLVVSLIVFIFSLLDARNLSLDEEGKYKNR